MAAHLKNLKQPGKQVAAHLKDAITKEGKVIGFPSDPYCEEQC